MQCFKGPNWAGARKSFITACNCAKNLTRPRSFGTGSRGVGTMWWEDFACGAFCTFCLFQQPPLPTPANSPEYKAAGPVAGSTSHLHISLAVAHGSAPPRVCAGRGEWVGTRSGTQGMAPQVGRGLEGVGSLPQVMGQGHLNDHV